MWAIIFMALLLIMTRCPIIDLRVESLKRVRRRRSKINCVNGCRGPAKRFFDDETDNNPVGDRKLDSNAS